MNVKNIVKEIHHSFQSNRNDAASGAGFIQRHSAVTECVVIAVVVNGQKMFDARTDVKPVRIRNFDFVKRFPFKENFTEDITVVGIFIHNDSVSCQFRFDADSGKITAFDSDPINPRRNQNPFIVGIFSQFFIFIDDKIPVIGRTGFVFFWRFRQTPDRFAVKIPMCRKAVRWTKTEFSFPD